MSEKQKKKKLKNKEIMKNSMENVEYLNSLYQVSEIINYLSPELKNKIPKKLLTYFEQNKSKNYNWNLDKTKSLKEQDLLENTKEILTMIYKEYLCDEKEKPEIEKVLIENEINYQKSLSKKYSSDVFSKKNRVSVYTDKTSNVELLKQEESIFKRIINKIKSIFKK